MLVHYDNYGLPADPQSAKYSGDLTSVEVYPSSDSGRVSSFTVAFTSLSATSSTGTDLLTPNNYAEAAILDSGTTITLLPDSIAQSVFEELGATVSEELGAVVVPCALANNDGTLNYGFGGTGGKLPFRLGLLLEAKYLF